MRIGLFPHRGQLNSLWHVLCIWGVAWVLQLQHAFLLLSLVSSGTVFASLQHVFHRWVACVLQGLQQVCHRVPWFCGTGFATRTCVLLFVFHFICFFWYSLCIDPGRQHLPILTKCLAFAILLVQLIKQGTFDTLDKCL